MTRQISLENPLPALTSVWAGGAVSALAGSAPAGVDPRILPLLSTAAVRSRARILFVAALAGRLPHFSVHLDRLDATATYVVETIRQNYPALEIPFHALWRHFSAGRIDRWAALAPVMAQRSREERARAAFDLVIISALLDATSGSKWRYEEEATGLTLTRSEGLGVASLAMFASGAFSADPHDPLRCDASRLASITADDIARHFQVNIRSNPLAGLDGRVALLRGLGQAMLAAPAVFATHDGLRPGALYDRIAELSENGQAPAPAIVTLLLIHLGPIWPGRLSLHGVPLGDTWAHPMVRSGDAGDGLIPFHGLTQWLAYSLIEPLQGAGLTVTDIDALTGLPELRNGGLMLDSGLISLKDKAEARRKHEPGSQLVVEWRALTVVLLDLVADRVRMQLGRSRAELPLARVLEGGTWAAGRRIAAEKRGDGRAPLSIASDGTVL